MQEGDVVGGCVGVLEIGLEFLQWIKVNGVGDPICGGCVGWVFVCFFPCVVGEKVKSVMVFTVYSVDDFQGL